MIGGCTDMCGGCTDMGGGCDFMYSRVVLLVGG